jgi:hypothetical protein
MRRIQRVCNRRHTLTKAARTRKQERRNTHGGKRRSRFSDHWWPR